jgi:hypothetical protein
MLPLCFRVAGPKGAKQGLSLKKENGTAPDQPLLLSQQTQIKGKDQPCRLVFSFDLGTKPCS